MSEGTTQEYEYPEVGVIGSYLGGWLPWAELGHFVLVESSMFENFPAGWFSVQIASSVFSVFALLY